MDEATSVVFEMEEASEGTMNDGASKVCGIEEVPTCAESLNTHAHFNILKSPFPKVTITSKGIASNYIEQMKLFDQMDPRCLK